MRIAQTNGPPNITTQFVITLPSEHKILPKCSSSFLCCSFQTIQFPSRFPSFPKSSTYFQPTFTRRTSGHSLGNFKTVRSSPSLFTPSDNNNNNRNNWRGKVSILRNQQVRTDRTVPNNKPDIIMRDNEKRTCILIDVAISADSNVIKKEADKF